jgi:SAM-dependent methyltransferase
VVRHSAGLAEGEPGQAAALTPEQARRLLSPAGRDAVTRAGSLDLSPAGRLQAAQAMRTAVGPELGPLALEQALLKARAKAKHPSGDRLWWTAEALEQASSYTVATHRATRFVGSDLVLDLGCSVGGDLLPLAGVARVIGVDLDETRLLLAQANARELGVDVQLVRADVTQLEPKGSVFADPARRSSGRRVFDPRAYTPSLDQVLGWLPRLDALAVKVAPGIDYDALPAEIEVEIVSLRGEVKEAVLWAGNVRRGSRRTATLLPGGDLLADDPVPAPMVRPPGPFLLEPDGAVVRAHLVAQLAAQVGGWLVDDTIAYIAADAVVPTPFGSWYAVHETMPFGLKHLRTRLRTYDAGPLVVKKRGTAVEPEQLRKQLKLTGSREVTVILTRAAGRQIAMVAQPVVASL